MQRRRARAERRPRAAHRRRGPEDAIESGKVGGAALDVFPAEPITEHPLFGYPNVVVTPHLGASTAEATDRAGFQAAEQIVAALNGGTVTSAVEHAGDRAEDLEVLGPFLPLAPRWAASRSALAEGSSVERSRSSSLAASPSATPARSASPRCSACSEATPRRTLNAVNAQAAGRGSRDRARRVAARERARLHRPHPRHRLLGGERDRVVGTTLGRRLPAPARGVGPALQPPARAVHRAVALPRRAGHDRQARHAFGEHG